MPESTFTDADLAYISGNYVTLDALCADRPESVDEVRALIAQRRLPGPSYVLDDGTGMFSPDYFRLVDQAGGAERLREHFAARHRAATRAACRDTEELEADWSAYLDGTYGVCLHEVTPEAIVRKTALVSSICELLTLAQPRSAKWRQTLREQVDALDVLERDFAPHFDRSEEQRRLPTRDLLIAAARERYPDVFAADVS